MEVTTKKNEKVAQMIFSDIYPLYLKRILKNRRTKEELDQIIKWFTGYNQSQLEQLINDKITFKHFSKMLPLIQKQI